MKHETRNLKPETLNKKQTLNVNLLTINHIYHINSLI